MMDKINDISADAIQWRRHLHQNPELLFDVHQTADFVADKLRHFGCDQVVTGVGQTGVIGLIKGQLGDGPVIGLRAEMDALPILEASGRPWASKEFCRKNLRVTSSGLCNTQIRRRNWFNSAQSTSTR